MGGRGVGFNDSDASGMRGGAVDDWDEPADDGAGADEDLGEFRGVVLNDTGPVQTVPEAPSAPAQPPRETLWPPAS